MTDKLPVEYRSTQTHPSGSLPEELELEFLKQFVNTHNTEWRPLRGLWVEEVLAFAARCYEAGRADADKEMVEMQKHYERRYEAFQAELNRLRSSQPGRGKPVIRIMKDGNWYIPMITKYFDTPDGVIVEGTI